MHRTRSIRRRLLGAVLAVVALTAGAACGDDDDTDDASAETSTTESPSDGDAEGDGDAGGDTVLVTGVDYAYEDLPATASVGTELTFTNASATEVHEMVLLKVADGETRPLPELLQLPEDEQSAVTEFRGVTVAFPGEDAGFTDGSMTLTEPGRYVVICVIPTGADPQAYREAVADPNAEGPPDVDGGPPHVVQGMAGEIEVN